MEMVEVLPIRRQRSTKWIIKKHNPTICYLPDTHFKYDSIGRLKVKGWIMIHQANIN